MTTVASLTIEMAANVARLQSDMARAANTVQSATAKMQKAAETAGRALGAIGAGLTVAAFTGFIRGAINAADETSKLSQKIGVTVKDVAGLQLAFRQAGVSQEAMATGLARLSKGIAEGNDGLKSLGIATKNNDGTLKTSRQVLAEVADQFAKTGDGATKTARAQEIFGKTGADLIPLLNAGSKALDEYDALASKLGLTLSDETAKQAEAFNDTLDLVGQGVQGVGRQIAGQLLPTLTGLASEFFNTVSSGDNLKKTADFLAAALKGLYSAGVIGVEIFSSLGKTLGGVAAAVVAAVSGNFKQAGTIIGDLQSDVGTGWKEALAQVDRAWNTTGDNTVANLAQINKAQMTSTKSLEDGKKAAQEYAKFLDQMRGKVAELSGVNADYIKQLVDLDKARKANFITEAQYIALVEQLIAKQPSSIKLAKEQADAIKQVADAEEDGLKVYAAYLSELQKGVTTQRERIAALELEAEAERLAETLNISLARAVELVNVAKLEERRLSERDPAVIKALEDEIAARKRIAELTGNKDVREVNKQAAQDAANEWKRFTDDLERGLTDSLFRAFEAGRGFFSTLWDGIKNLFKTTVLKAIIQPVVGGITGALGLTGAANAATTGGGIGNLLNLGSNLSTAYSALTGSFITSIGSAATAAGNLFGSTAIAEFGLGLQGLALPSSTGALAAGGSTASALSSAAAAGPYVLAAVAALNALGVFRSRKIVDGGLQGTLGGQVNDYALQRRGGTLFSGPDYSVLDRGVSAQNDELQKAYSAIRDTVSGMAEQLGIGNDAIKAFTVQLGNDLIHPDTGGFGIKTQGLSQDEILKKIEAALLSANEQLAAFALGTTEFTRDGETAVQTLGRLSGSLGSVNSVFKTLGLTLADASLAGADAASKFVDSFGGAEQFAQVASSYYQNFYTEAERTANTVEALRQRFFELGTAGATTREGFRALVEEQQRLHGATSPVVAELLKLSDTFASVVPAIDAVTEAAAQQAEQAQQQAAAINAERSDRLRIERETAAAAKAAAEELAKLNEQNFRLAISAGNVSAALAARGNNGPRFADFQGANGFNAAGYNLASIFSQQRSAQDILAETRRQNPFEVADFFGVVRELENTIASFQANIDSGEFTGGVSSTEQAAQAAFGDFLSPEQIQAAADGLTSFSSVLAVFTGTAQAGTSQADAALRALEGAYTGAAQDSIEYARGLDIIGQSVGVFTGNLQEIKDAIKLQVDYFNSGEYYQAVSQEALRQQVSFTSEAFRNLTARAASFNTETGNLETSFDVLDGFIGRLKSVQDAFANAAGDRATEAGLISQAASQIASIITTPVAEQAREALAGIDAFAGLDRAALRDISLLVKDIGQFDNLGLEKSFIRVSDALGQGTINGEQYAAVIDYIKGVYLGSADEQRRATEELAQAQLEAAERARDLALNANRLALGDLERAVADQKEILNQQLQGQLQALQAMKDSSREAYDLETDRINGVRDAQREALELQLNAASDSVSAIRSIYNEISGAIGRTTAQSTAATLLLQQQARDYLRQAISGSAAGVRLTQFTGLSGALDTVGNQSPELFRTFDEFLAAQDESVDLVRQLEGNAKSQVSVAEMTLEAIKANIAAVEMTAKLQSDAAKALLDQQLADAESQAELLSTINDQQLARLDQLLKNGRDAIALADGTFRATLGLNDAILNLQGALQGSLSQVELSNRSLFESLSNELSEVAAMQAVQAIQPVPAFTPVAAFTPAIPAAQDSGTSNGALIAEIQALRSELQQIKTNTAVGARVLQGAYGPDGTNPVLVEIEQ